MLNNMADFMMLKSVGVDNRSDKSSSNI